MSARVLENRWVEREGAAFDSLRCRVELRQKRIDVDAAMERRIRSQSQTRFLELAFAANPFATAGLVPGHGHVHEPLEEIALLGLGGAPRVLELFVRGEELAAPDQLEAPLERLSGRL